jgi:hypothetical protein
MRSFIATAFALSLVTACSVDEPQRSRPAPTASTTSPEKHVEIVLAPEGENVPAVVTRELERAKADHRDLVVYVGAPWCEPCTRFHKAAQAGELDKSFPTLRLLEFDQVRDEERLRAAGYTSRLIPLFALPRADGQASGDQIEGSIKGDGAVAEIAPRLRALIGRR